MSEQSRSTGRIRGSGSRRRKPSRGRRVKRIALCCAAALVVIGGSGLGYAYFTLNGNLKGVDIDAALGADRPDDVDNGSQDILVLGSDSRSGANSQYGADEGSARADTAMVVHVDEGHKAASVVSIRGTPSSTAPPARATPAAKRSAPSRRRCSTRRTPSAGPPAR